jgi:hypothetical protein
MALQGKRGSEERPGRCGVRSRVKLAPFRGREGERERERYRGLVTRSAACQQWLPCSGVRGGMEARCDHVEW